MSISEEELKAMLRQNPAVKVAGETNIEKFAGVARKSRALLPEELEDAIQAAFFEWLELNQNKFPELKYFFAIPNGTNKTRAERGIFLITGLKPGIPDTHLPLPRKDKAGLWIEFKSKNGKVSRDQEKWIDMLREQNHQVEVCRTWQAAANVTIDYLDLPIKKFEEQNK